jgi:hypothetical protein
MNQRFFIHSITIYHDNDDGTVTRMIFDGVYFRHNKKSNVIDKGFEKGSTGTIYIPTKQDLNISNTDIVVEGTPTLSVKSVNKKTVNYIDKIQVKRLIVNKENPNDEFNRLFTDSSIQRYRVVSVDDNRKGNLQHYKLGVSE